MSCHALEVLGYVYCMCLCRNAPRSSAWKKRPILKRPFIAVVSFHSCFGHGRTRIRSAVTVKKIVNLLESTSIIWVTWEKIIFAQLLSKVLALCEIRVLTVAFTVICHLSQPCSLTHPISLRYILLLSSLLRWSLTGGWRPLVLLLLYDISTLKNIKKHPV